MKARIRPAYRYGRYYVWDIIYPDGVTTFVWGPLSLAYASATEAAKKLMES